MRILIQMDRVGKVIPTLDLIDRGVDDGRLSTLLISVEGGYMVNNEWNYKLDTLLLADQGPYQELSDVKYYYLCAVRLKPKKDMTSEFYLDSILSFNTIDIAQAALARGMAENELVPTTVTEALAATGLTKLSGEIYGFHLRARANMSTVHKFICDSPMAEDDIDTYIRSANFCDSARKKLQESRVRY